MHTRISILTSPNIQCHKQSIHYHTCSHALGIGTLWADLGLSNTNTNTYGGVNGVAGFKQIGGTGNSVPLEAGTQAGTSGVHWSEATFANEVSSHH
jgi:hypothetical protein